MFRLSAKLAARLHTEPGPAAPLVVNAYADWSAQLFTADRTRNILLSNTAPRYSMVLRGRGLTDDGQFVGRDMRRLGQFLRADGFGPDY